MAELDTCERWFWFHESHHNVSLTATLRSPVDEASLRLAAAALALSHAPFLHTVSHDGPSWVPRADSGAAAAARAVVQVGSPRNQLRAWLDTNFDDADGPEGGLLFRLGFSGQQVILVFSHSAGDGTSGWVFLQRLLRAYESADPGLLDAVLAAETDAAAAAALGVSSFPPAPNPALDTLLDVSPSPLALAGALAKLLLPWWLRPSAIAERTGLSQPPWLGPEEALPESEVLATGGPLSFSLTEEETRALRDAARAEGATVHGAMVGAAARSLSAALWPSVAERSFLVASPMDLRKVAGLPADQTGNYLTAEKVEVDPQLPMWETARNYMREFNDMGDSKWRGWGMLKYAPSRDWREAVHAPTRRGAVNGRTETIQISNLTHHETAPGELQELEAVEFSQQARDAGSLLSVSVITVNGRLTGTVTWPAPLLSSETVQQFVAGFVAALKV